MADEPIYIAIPTEIGLDKIQRAMFTEQNLELSTLSYGDGGGSYYYPNPIQTSLRHELGSCPVIDKRLDYDNNVTWFYSIIGATLPSGVIREVGLYDTEGDLCFVANTPDINKAPTEEGTLVDVPIEIGIKNSYSQYITIPVLDPTPTLDYATQLWVDTYYANRQLSNIDDDGKNVIATYGAGPIFYDEYYETTIPEGTKVILKDKDNNVLIPVGTGSGSVDGVNYFAPFAVNNAKIVDGKNATLESVYKYYKINANKTGTLTIGNSGEVSGFGVSNYFSFDQSLDITDNTVMVFDFVTGSNVTNTQVIIDTNYIEASATAATPYIALVISSGNLNINLSTALNLTAYDIGQITSTVVANTHYKYRIEFNGEEYKVTRQVGTNTSYEDVGTITSSTKIGGGYGLLFGRSRITSSGAAFGGTINFNKCYITIDNQLFWNGVRPVTQDGSDLLINATVVGSLTIQNGVVSNFSNTSYLLLDNASVTDSFEFSYTFTTGADVTTKQFIKGSAVDYQGLIFGIYNGHFVLNCGTGTTSPWSITGNDLSGTYAVQPDTTYTVKVTYDGTDYKLSYLSGESYIEDISVTSATQLGTFTNTIGLTNSNGNYLLPFLGSIDLKECYIKVNDQIWWQGTTVIEGIPDYDFAFTLLKANSAQVTTVDDKTVTTEERFLSFNSATGTSDIDTAIVFGTKTSNAGYISNGNLSVSSDGYNSQSDTRDYILTDEIPNVKTITASMNTWAAHRADSNTTLTALWSDGTTTTIGTISASGDGNVTQTFTIEGEGKALRGIRWYWYGGAWSYGYASRGSSVWGVSVSSSFNISAGVEVLKEVTLGVDTTNDGSVDANGIVTHQITGNYAADGTHTYTLLQPITNVTSISLTQRMSIQTHSGAAIQTYAVWDDDTTTTIGRLAGDHYYYDQSVQFSIDGGGRSLKAIRMYWYVAGDGHGGDTWATVQLPSPITIVYKLEQEDDEDFDILVDTNTSNLTLGDMHYGTLPPGYEVHGNPHFDSESLVANSFTANDWVQSDKIIPFSSTSSIDMVTCFKVNQWNTEFAGTNPVPYAILCAPVAADYQAVNLMLDCSSKKMNYCVSTNGTSWNVINGQAGTLVFELNTWYYVRYVWDGTNHSFYISTTGNFKGEEVLDLQVAGTTAISNAIMGFGQQAWQTAANRAKLALKGEIDFSNSYIKLSGNLTSATTTEFEQPSLTSNGTPGGDFFACFASYQYPGFYAYQAFDKKANTFWGTGSGSDTAGYVPQSIGFYNPDALKVSKLTIKNRADSSYYIPTAGYVEGSNDGSTYTQLTTFTNTTLAAGANWEIDLSSNTNYYNYYKVTFTAEYSSDHTVRHWVNIAELMITATLENSSTVISHAGGDYIMPDASKYWLDYSTTPANLRKYVGNTMSNKYPTFNNLVHLGNCTLSNGSIINIQNRVLNSNGYSHGTDTMAIMSRPGGRQIPLQRLTTGSTYIAPATGEIQVHNSVSSSGYVKLINLSTGQASVSQHTGSVSCSIDVTKGDTFNFDYAGINDQINVFSCLVAKGSENTQYYQQ